MFTPPLHLFTISLYMQTEMSVNKHKTQNNCRYLIQKVQHSSTVQETMWR